MQATRETTGVVHTTNENASSSHFGVTFVTACVVLPVVWGIIVHLTFTWLRRKHGTDQKTAPTWPDYQI